MTHVDNQPNWLREPPPAAYAALIDAARHYAYQQPDQAHHVLASSGVDVRWLAGAGVRALARMVAGPQASAWWEKLRGEINNFSDPARSLDVAANLEIIAVAEAFERGALRRVTEIAAMTDCTPDDYVFISARHIGNMAAHAEQRGVCSVDEMMQRLRRACGLEVR